MEESLSITLVEIEERREEKERGGGRWHPPICKVVPRITMEITRAQSP